MYGAAYLRFSLEKALPQGLKPTDFGSLIGTAETVPFQGLDPGEFFPICKSS
jgi:hypothetical protein